MIVMSSSCHFLTYFLPTRSLAQPERGRQMEGVSNRHTVFDDPFSSKKVTFMLADVNGEHQVQVLCSNEATSRNANIFFISR